LPLDTSVYPTTAEPEPEGRRSALDRMPQLPGPLRTQPARIAGLLAAAWVLPLLTHVLHADLLTLAAVVLGTASLLRAGHTLLDRLMITAALLSGVLITIGLLF